MYKRLLTIQDISCFGQCSLTVALPILSACGLETVILPSAVLSTHTMGFSGFTVRDLTDDMPAIAAHWKKEGISFDAIYTGYLGSAKQIDYVKDMIKNLLREGAVKVIDPAMADGGKLYPAFDMAFVQEMKKLCAVADYVLPNITEACFLTGIEYKENYDEAYVKSLVKGLLDLGAKNVVLTGVGYKASETGVVVSDGKSWKHYVHRKIAKGCHGTGDVYASAFTGALLRGHSAYDSAVIAADYVVDCIEVTQQDKDHTYGVEFERTIPQLIEKL